MNDKTVIVTGANSGVGLATAVELARQGARVIMACRSPERGEQALQLAMQRSGSRSLELMRCDLGSLDSIRAFASAFQATHPRLDVLINNAGVVSLKRQLTQDGFESQLGVNHLGHFLLTLLLLTPLRAAPQGRVVNVSSDAHRVGFIRWDDPHFARGGYTVWRGYGQSKLANILFTKGLAYRLRGSRVTANALHPGAVATRLGVDRQTGFGHTLTRLLKPFFLTPEQGADSSLYLATSDQVAGVSGDYFYRRAPARLPSRAEDREDIERLWFWSEKQVGEVFPTA